jgi:hypothetical protein
MKGKLGAEKQAYSERGALAYKTTSKIIILYNTIIPYNTTGRKFLHNRPEFDITGPKDTISSLAVDTIVKCIH